MIPRRNPQTHTATPARHRESKIACGRRLRSPVRNRPMLGTFVASIAIASCLTLRLHHVGEASSPAVGVELWQGAFKSSNIWGAMEMTIAQAIPRQAHVRFSLDRTPLDSAVSRVRVSATAVSFAAVLGGTEYSFTGRMRDSQWVGAMRSTSHAPDSGT